MGANLSEKLMLCKLSVSQWSGRKYDKSVTKHVDDEYGAINAGRYTKALLAEDALKEIQKIVNESRTWYYEQTLPWQDAGSRILPAANYFQCTRELQRFQEKFQNAVSAFGDNYLNYIEAARYRLNGLFKESDYPSLSKLSKMFSFSVDFSPLPSASDFRVQISDEEVAQIRADIESRTQEATKVAMAELWSRVHAAVSAMVERLSDDKAIFRDSLIGNVQDLVNLLPRMNITDNADLERMRVEMEAKLCTYKPQELRENKGLRAAAAADAKAVLDAMAGYCGAA
jgi:hypothetical protein